MYIIKLTNNSWVAGWEGDPGRTICLENAQIFGSRMRAEKTLKKIIKENKHRDYSKAQVKRVMIKELEEELDEK